MNGLNPANSGGFLRENVNDLGGRPLADSKVDGKDARALQYLGKQVGLSATSTATRWEERSDR